VCNVHGVRAEFLAIGAAAAERSRAQNGAQVDLGGGDTAWPGGAYFLGKAMFTKGYRELIEALVAYRDASGETTRASPRTSTTSTTGISFGIVSGGGSSSDGSSGDGSSSSSDGNPAALSDCELLPVNSDCELLPVNSDCELLPHVDTFGSGPDYDAIVARVETEQLPIDVHPGIDHAHPTMHGYRVFVNPSTSDVLCTATAEALAMGKKVLIPDHPSNTFFRQFSNCIMYTDPKELVPLLREALSTEPQPLSPIEQYRLSWDAASERLLDAAALPLGTPRTRDSISSSLCYYTHYAMGVQPVFDVFRTVTGAPPVVPWGERAKHWRTFGRVADEVDEVGRRER
jgi:hypothetical protein